MEDKMKKTIHSLAGLLIGNFCLAEIPLNNQNNILQIQQSSYKPTSSTYALFDKVSEKSLDEDTLMIVEFPDAYEVLLHSFTEGIEQGVFQAQDQATVLMLAHEINRIHRAFTQYAKGELSFLEFSRILSDVTLIISAYSYLFPWDNIISRFPREYHLQIEFVIDLIEKVSSKGLAAVNEVYVNYLFKKLVHDVIYEKLYHQNTQQFFENVLAEYPFRVPADLHHTLVSIQPMLYEQSHRCCREAIAIEGGSLLYLAFLNVAETIHQKSKNDNLNQWFQQLNGFPKRIVERSLNISISEVSHYTGCMFKIPHHLNITESGAWTYVERAGLGGAIKYGLRKVLSDTVDILKQDNIYHYKRDIFSSLNIDKLSNEIILSHRDQVAQRGAINSIIYALEAAFPQGYGASAFIPILAEVFDEYLKNGEDEKEAYHFVVNGIKIGYLTILAVNRLYESQRIINLCKTSIEPHDDRDNKPNKPKHHQHRISLRFTPPVENKFHVYNKQLLLNEEMRTINDIPESIIDVPNVSVFAHFAQHQT